ncbi:MAG TPA: 5'-3'-deoxyribonucleotidase [Acidobacteriaceae bacterium]|jgi:5'(3')-deoxyribonucleotidase|nr:5'-3'-deoxyribonucleotidase [Acidobacteriaceae bacterium]
MSHGQREPRPIICVDMDEVIADALSEHLLRYNRDFRERITPADLQGQWLWDFVPPERQQVLADYMMSNDFFSVLGVMPHAQRVLERLQSRYDIFIATAAMEVPASFNAKFDWLQQHFPFIPASHIVFCGDKGILRGDFLIDDNPRQLRRFRGEGILFNSPANAFVTGFRRVQDWLEVEQLFLLENSA